MSSATVTSKGQVTIPVDVRHRLGLESGDRIEFVEIADGEFAIRPVIQDVRALKGLLKKPAKPVSVAEMRVAVKKRGSRN
ncbi:MAG: AbrB/MazE/SpoVT family DNA-binding domain-containing protein [Candidatus Obscuribacterales bacterium]|nr:AbrB/MazE/SpoVT family DNA-binding domain-containing protein [Candidatus Obscuribacterales bacterium]